MRLWEWKWTIGWIFDVFPQKLGINVCSRFKKSQAWSTVGFKKLGLESARCNACLILTQFTWAQVLGSVYHQVLLSITILRLLCKCKHFCASLVSIECLVLWSTHANAWNTLDVSVAFPTFISAESLLTVNRAMKLGHDVITTINLGFAIWSQVSLCITTVCNVHLSIHTHMLICSPYLYNAALLPKCQVRVDSNG